MFEQQQDAGWKEPEGKQQEEKDTDFSRAVPLGLASNL